MSGVAPPGVDPAPTVEPVAQGRLATAVQSLGATPAGTALHVGVPAGPGWWPLPVVLGRVEAWHEALLAAVPDRRVAASYLGS